MAIKIIAPFNHFYVKTNPKASQPLDCNLMVSLHIHHKHGTVLKTLLETSFSCSQGIAMQISLTIEVFQDVSHLVLIKCFEERDCDPLFKIQSL